MQITQIKIGELKPYKNNPRNNKCAVDAVANSIKELDPKYCDVIVDRYEKFTGKTAVKLIGGNNG